MNRPTLYVVTDDPSSVHAFKEFGEARGARVEVYSVSQWEEKMGNPTHLSEGRELASQRTTNVIHFPNRSAQHDNVESITDLEAKAIENAIHAFEGNLTEAAKALGIGRATLYRKVKQYNIDPSQARRKRAA